MKESDDLKKSTEVISENITDFNEIKDVIKDLKNQFHYKQAREVLLHLLSLNRYEDENLIWVKQQLALCTYKDHEIHPVKGYKKALEILEELGLRKESCDDAETLALGGAVCKRKWEYDGQVENLYESLSFYRAAWEKNAEQDKGYGAVNAAFILMTLANRARVISKRSGAKKSSETTEFQKKAKVLYKAVISSLEALTKDKPEEKNNYWIVVTLAEAYLGVCDYVNASKWLKLANELIASDESEVGEWKRQSTFRQLVSLARLMGKELPKNDSDVEQWEEPWKTLSIFLGDKTKPALGCYRGKVGLALSGGGFRASLYHIGVLARLAELDVLKSVEVLSTVSGGSIVGAYYYLKVQELLETKDDQKIDRQDYIEIVQEIETEFLEGIQTNLRVKAISNFWKNLKMITSKEYGRSNRLGELYEEVLYNKVKHRQSDRSRIYMDDLIIKPKGLKETFKPVFSNWQRHAKVPALLLNATSLNSGHNWRFTARSMGEPPGLLGTDVDKNTRYRRLYYEEAPEEFKKYPLGNAVAASACVPGLFDPLTLDGLYEDKVVRLVDGGVHDNQGVEGLLDEGCNFIFCSDASGQMTDEDNPSDSIPFVLLRSSSISMDRVREAEYQDLRGRADSNALHGLFFVHLKKDLQAKQQGWIGSNDNSLPQESDSAETPYGIDPEIQQLLSEMRTDLDSFTEVEANALMCSGYLMTSQQIESIQQQHKEDGETGHWGGFKIDAADNEGDWNFLKLRPYLKSKCKDVAIKKDLLKQLRVSSLLFMKIWNLDEKLIKIKRGLIIVGILLSLFIAFVFWNCSLLKVKYIFIIAAVLLIPQIPKLFKDIKSPWVKEKIDWLVKNVKWLFPQKAVKNIIQNIFIAFVGSWLATLHLIKFDKMFIARGMMARLASLKNLKGEKES